MTARSTRNKMKWQCEMMMKNLTRCQGHLKLLSDLSEGESEYINNTIASLVTLTEMLYQTVKTFRGGL